MSADATRETASSDDGAALRARRDDGAAPHAEPITRPPIESGDARFDTLRALLTLLPAAILVWPGPGAFLRDDLAPQFTGAGVAAIASFPAALALAVRRAQVGVRGLAWLLLVLLSTVAWTGSDRLTDTFDASRAVLMWSTALVLVLSGASLGPRGRRTLAHGVVALACVLLADAAFDAEHVGVLGNTGTVAEAALPGALIGALLLWYARVTWKIVSIAALVGFLVYASSTPVLAGALSAAVALGIAAIVHAASGSRARVAFAVLALGAVASVALPIVRDSSAGEDEPNAAAVPDTGGLEVRARILGASLRMAADDVWLGIGPGQFAARFPPYRDAREIELSSHGRTAGVETEVEHAHDDWIAPAIDAGVLVGLAWIAFLATVGVLSLHRLRSSDPVDAALALAALGLLVNALADATLTFHPVSSCLAFAIFGCVLARETPVNAPMLRRAVAWLAAGVLALGAPRALAMVRHGRALAELARLERIDAPGVPALIERALDAAPDSVLALTLAARAAESRRMDEDRARSHWLSVLARRPDRVEAWIQLGVGAALVGNRAGARTSFERALALDPHHPGVLQNLMTLEFEDGRAAEALAYLDRRQSSHPLDHAWLRELAARLYLRGKERESESLFERIEPELSGVGAEAAYALAKRFRDEGAPVVGDAFESRARRMWAREHGAEGRWQPAIASYRQDLRISRDYIEGGATSARLELAAALVLGGREEEARSETVGIDVTEADWTALPDWAREALRDRAWIDR